jgi:hypothetical protein
MSYCATLINYETLPLVEGTKHITYPGFPEGMIESTSAGDATGTLFAVERVRLIGNKVAEWLGLPPIPDDLDHLTAYAAYKELMREGARKYQETGEICRACLSAPLIGLEGMRVEVHDDFGDAFRYNVSRSKGWMPVHVHLDRDGVTVRIPNNIRAARVLRQGRN